MKKFLLILLSFCSLTLSAGNVKWLRYPSISPDGKTVVFSFKGNLYTVSSEGGEARQLTAHQAHDYAPVWSPDGKTIAFASDRFGNFDIYTIPAKGGVPTRITTNSAKETPWTFTPDGRKSSFQPVSRILRQVCFSLRVQ